SSWTFDGTPRGPASTTSIAATAKVGRWTGTSARHAQRGSPRRAPAFGSFVAKRLDGIELRRLARGVQPEHDADEGAEADGDGDDIRLNKHGPLEARGEVRRSANVERDPEEAAGERQDERLDQELREDVQRLGADGHAHTDLARPLCDAHEHDVHDADPA